MFRAFVAIVKQTARESVRSRVFHILLVLLLLAVFLLPITVKGPGTAVADVRITLKYSISAIIFLVSAAALWTGCSHLPSEIETYRLHLVTTKPVPRWLLWAGKWCAVFGLHALLFLFAAAVVFFLVQWRITHGNYSANELKKLRQEVLTARQRYEPQQPDFVQKAIEKYREKQEKGELSPDHNPRAIKRQLLRQVKGRYTEVPAGGGKTWLFKNVYLHKKNQPLFLRYRLYVGGTKSAEQRLTRGTWSVRVPRSRNNQRSRVYLTPQQSKGGAFRVIRIPSESVDKKHRVVVRYTNEDRLRESVVFQLEDGPQLLVAAGGFAGNYVRAMVLVIFELMFVSALGCMVGAAFSSPVAIFTGVAYLLIGAVVHGVAGNSQGSPFGMNTGAAQIITGYLADFINALVVSLRDFNATNELAQGRLVGMSRLVGCAVSFILLRGVPIALLGMLILTRRELGRVIRR